MASTTTALKFKPWPRVNEDDNSLGNILGRIQLDRGHFRDITEQALQEEIAAEGALVISDNDTSDDEDENEDSGEEGRDQLQGQPKSIEQILKAKMEMVQHIKAAQDDIDYARDFVSLLISKDLPRQANASIAPNLAKEIPMGTLGVDIWQRTSTDKVQETQDKALAVGVRMKALERSADNLLAAATRLESNMRKETRYWDQVLSISEEGWNVSKMPGRPHRLGVRFGLKESSQEFSRRGLAALDTEQDGTIALDGAVMSKLRRLKATVQKNGITVGISQASLRTSGGTATLESRIRCARDSLLDEELFHEMVRESRSLAALQVHIEQDTIKCPIPGSDTILCLELEPWEKSYEVSLKRTNEDDEFAQAIALAARLLLLQAHRDRLSRKSEIPEPLGDERNDEKPLFPILRPIMSFITHISSMDQLNSYLADADQILAAANIKSKLLLSRIVLPDDIKSANAETLLTTLMQPWVSHAELAISHPTFDDLVFRFKIETTLARGFGTTFTAETSDGAERFLFNEINDLVYAADDKLASSLAAALSALLGDGSKCLRREASVLLSDAEGTSKRIVVSFNSRSKKLKVTTPRREHFWTGGDNKVTESFWDTKIDIL